ncbi:MAG: transcriptional regulator, partial [Veillonella sp.]|nr:transcriptional regulator [Veillonella sp.]
QFRKPHRHDGSNMHMDQHMMDGNNQMMPQDGMGPNNGQHMYQNCQMSPQDQPSQGYQPNGNASEQAPNGETQAQ